MFISKAEGREYVYDEKTVTCGNFVLEIDKMENIKKENNCFVFLYEGRSLRIPFDPEDEVAVSKYLLKNQSDASLNKEEKRKEKKQDQKKNKAIKYVPVKALIYFIGAFVPVFLIMNTTISYNLLPYVPYIGVLFEALGTLLALVLVVDSSFVDELKAFVVGMIPASIACCIMLGIINGIGFNFSNILSILLVTGIYYVKSIFGLAASIMIIFGIVTVKKSREKNKKTILHSI